MIEFSEDLSTKLTGVQAMRQRAMFRLSVMEGDIPYFDGGFDYMLYSHNNDLARSVRRVLSDFNVSVTVSSDGKIFLGDVVLTLPNGVFSE